MRVLFLCAGAVMSVCGLALAVGGDHSAVLWTIGGAVWMVAANTWRAP